MREIFRVERYIEQLKAVPAHFNRTAERIERLETSLQEDCEGYPGVIGMDLFYIRLVPFPAVAPLSIFFRFDDKTVYMLRADLPPELQADTE